MSKVLRFTALAFMLVTLTSAAKEPVREIERLERYEANGRQMILMFPRDPQNCPGDLRMALSIDVTKIVTQGCWALANKRIMIVWNKDKNIYAYGLDDFEPVWKKLPN